MFSVIGQPVPLRLAPQEVKHAKTVMVTIAKKIIFFI